MKRPKQPKFRVVGWIGMSEGKPFFEQIRDSYSDGLVLRAELFRSYKAARQRFKHVERVELRKQEKRG